MGPANGGKLTIYVDCGWFPYPIIHQLPNPDLTVSPYSWFGFTNTVRFRPLLNAHGVSVDIIPFFLGAARNGVGNPWTPTPKSKEAFSKQDNEMTGRLLGLKVVKPKDFPILSIFVSPHTMGRPELTCENSQFVLRRGLKITMTRTSSMLHSWL